MSPVGWYWEVRRLELASVAHCVGDWRYMKYGVAVSRGLSVLESLATGGKGQRPWMFHEKHSIYTCEK